MTTLKVGIASYREVKARTMAVGTRRASPRSRRAQGLVCLDGVLRKGPVGRQSRAAARHRREGAGFAR